MLPLQEKKYLLALARRSLENYFHSGEILKINPAELPSEKLKEKEACFITLTLDGKLRGCIGRLSPIQELYREVIENSGAAAFGDPRFSPLSPEEFPRIKIEISILTPPRVLSFKSTADLLLKLRPEIDGVILKKDSRQATFLPQVWGELKNPKEFLSHLCQKAGLSGECWKEEGIEIETYQAEVWGEQ